MFKPIPIVIEIEHKAQAAKSILELYGPLIAALIVGGLALLGILIKAKSEKNQKLMDIRIALHNAQVKLLSDLTAEVDAYCRASLQLLQSLEVIEDEDSSTTFEEQKEHHASRIAMSDKAANQRTTVIRAAAAYGTIPGSPNENPLHLTTYVEEFMDNLAKISQFTDSYNSRYDQIIDVTKDVSNYLKRLITYDEVQRSREFKTKRKKPTLPQPPPVMLGIWVKQMTLLHEITQKMMDDEAAAEEAAS